jgi:hypothetical protein
MGFLRMMFEPVHQSAQEAKAQCDTRRQAAGNEVSELVTTSLGTFPQDTSDRSSKNTKKALVNEFTKLVETRRTLVRCQGVWRWI